MVYVSSFREGSAEEKDLLGGKGANLAEMTKLGLPVPPGFTITTTACRAYLRAGGFVPSGLAAEVDEALHQLEEERGRRLGDPAAPLLLSVRSGARFSMPGMMDTVLNLGLNPETVKGVAELTGDPRFAYDAYRRFLEMFGKVVLDVPEDVLHRWRDGVLAEHAVPGVEDLDVEGLHDLVQAYKTAIRDHTGHPVPEDARHQLDLAIEAVFRSWNGRRARDYRRLEGIPDDLGTAVNVQVMVFGNAGPDCGTGVAFTRDPATGEATPYGDFLVNAQGEDVVAGVRATLPLAELAGTFPGPAAELQEVFATLERRYRDMCDIEFTIEHGTLFMLQTRVGKRTAQAAVRIATEMAEEGLITTEEAILRVKPEVLDRLLHPQLAPTEEHVAVASGLNASPGAAVGIIVIDPDDAVEAAERGDDVILVRTDTSPDDLHGMIAARGILTSRGGLVSHAAVVARGIGTPAVCGASEVVVDAAAHRVVIAGAAYDEGTVISIDGTTGQVFLGAVPVVEPEPTPQLETLLGWADDVARVEVRANADTAADAARARGFGARGVGLCRTEHMFLGDRLPVVQRMFLAEDEEAERASLAELHDVQVADFTTLLAELDGLPVTVRLLDAPLHEFLPDLDDLRRLEARGELDAAGQARLKAEERWEEENPMLGTRGCRLAVLKPHVYEVQVRALAEAAAARRAAGGDPRIEIMVPLVALPTELSVLRTHIREVLVEVLGEELAAEVPIGTMIETPRAALDAGALAAQAEFFSFGTNDLTQLAFGFSRDDLEGRVLARYIEDGILDVSPFQSLDEDGVGRLVELATKEGRHANPDLEIGVCGEHGGDPRSIDFLHHVGVDYVSCSPFRVPIARLSAGRAALTD